MKNITLLKAVLIVTQLVYLIVFLHLIFENSFKELIVNHFYLFCLLTFVLLFLRLKLHFGLQNSKYIIENQKHKILIALFLLDTIFCYFAINSFSESFIYKFHYENGSNDVQIITIIDLLKIYLKILLYSILLYLFSAIILVLINKFNG